MKDIKEMKDMTFRVRCYEKTTLANLYFPQVKPETAVKHLHRWICRCTALLNEMQADDYHPRSKMFSAREVRLIVRHLGEPDLPEESGWTSLCDS